MKVSPYAAGRPAANRLPQVQQRLVNYVTVHGHVTVDQAQKMLALPAHLCIAALNSLVLGGHLRVQYVGEVAPMEVYVLR